jgi:hypothetical protein
MTQYLISASMKPYTVKVQFVEEAANWSEVTAKYPDAELIKVIKESK